MKQTPQARFAYQVGAVGEAGLTDSQLYGEALADAELIHRLGYDAAWVIEHHFSDYYPQPNPLMLLSYIAARCPGLGLGTAVMVLPWYSPLRFAEDIAMLQTLSTGELHIGMGRGTAKSEYEAFGIPMETARSRFAEAWDIARLALKGEPFTFDGEFVKIAEPILLRPQLAGRQPNFYGAIGSPGSAEVMADLDLPPLCLSNFPDHVLKSILSRWHREKAGAGQYIDLSLMDSQAAALSHHAMYYLVSGKNPQRFGTSAPAVVPSQRFECSDGFLALVVGNDPEFRRFAEVVGHPEWADDKRFSTNGLRVRNRATLVPLLEAIFRRSPKAHWLERLEAAGIVSGPINEISDVFADPQVLSRNMAVEVEHPLGGPLKLVANPPRMSETPLDRYEAPPLLGQHTVELLSGVLGLGAAEIDELLGAGIVGHP